MEISKSSDSPSKLLTKDKKKKGQSERRRKKELKLQEREKKKKLKEKQRLDKRRERDKKKGKGKDDLPDHYLHFSWGERDRIIDDVPDLEFVPLVEFDEGACEAGKDSISGPNSEESVVNLTLGNGECIMSGRTVSTYPRVLEVPGLRQGDPICDCFGARSFTNGSIICVADGCGWGHSVRDAAVQARKTFLEQVYAGMPRCRTIRDIAHVLVETLGHAHNNILKGKSPFEAGTTTLVVGVVCRLRSDLMNEMREDMSATVTGSTIVRLEINDAVNTWGGDHLAASNGGSGGKGRGRKISIPFRPMGKRQGVKKKTRAGGGGGGGGVDRGNGGGGDGGYLSSPPDTPITKASLSNGRRDVAISKSQNDVRQRSVVPRSEKIFNSSPACSSFRSISDVPSGESECDSKGEHGESATVGDMLHQRRTDTIRKRPGWCVVFLSLGDCKLFRRTQDGRVVDLTVGNRVDIRDPRDCGGRIGPSQENDEVPGLPDLRNLDVGFDLCNDGDTLIGLSDGVYDNIDPEFAGKSPTAFGLDAESWDDVDPEVLLRLKADFRMSTLMDLTARKTPLPFSEDTGGEPKEDARGDESDTTDADEEEEEEDLDGEALLDSTGHGDDGDPSVPALQVSTESIINYARSTTHKLRAWMENHPGQRQPAESESYPGKLDHTTCLSVRVGKPI